jgi:hypothetical protein
MNAGNKQSLRGTGDERKTIHLETTTAEKTFASNGEAEELTATYPEIAPTTVIKILTTNTAILV